jgi:methionyl-tRNA formyltransferase
MNCVLIGNGKMAIDCYKILVAEGWNILKIISSPREDAKGSSFQKYLTKNEVEFHATEAMNKAFDFDMFSGLDIDIVFTVNSYKILKSNWFKVPKIGIINFHNSMLPNYGGVNIPFWVIYNGEKKHGITWHFIDENVDEGNSISQREVDVLASDTNSKLTVKCIKAGIESFPDVLQKVKEDYNVNNYPKIGSGSYYSYQDFPEGNGEIDFDQPYEKINLLVRGLNYLPFQNDFCYAHINEKEQKVVVNRVSRMEKLENEVPNTYLGTNEEGKPIVACQDSLVILEECMTENMQLLTAEDIFEHANKYPHE